MIAQIARNNCRLVDKSLMLRSAEVQHSMTETRRGAMRRASMCLLVAQGRSSAAADFDLAVHVAHAAHALCHRSGERDLIFVRDHAAQRDDAVMRAHADIGGLQSLLARGAQRAARSAWRTLAASCLSVGAEAAATGAAVAAEALEAALPPCARTLAQTANSTAAASRSRASRHTRGRPSRQRRDTPLRRGSRCASGSGRWRRAYRSTRRGRLQDAVPRSCDDDVTATPAWA